MQQTNKPVAEQVVVLLGASSGIGRETAKRLSERGARIVVAARDQEGLDSLVQLIEASGGNAVSIACDVADYEQVRRVANRAIDRFGRIDTWVNVAGVGVYAPFIDLSPEEFARVVDVNLLGQVHGAKAALPHLLNAPGGGTLIGISSVEAVQPLPLSSAYAAAKHGVHGFLRTLRMELEHEKAPVRVTEIMPSAIDTPFFEKARAKTGVLPRGFPPVYPASLVADAILYACEHPARELVVGGAGKMIALGDKAIPGLLDAIIGRLGFRAQQTRVPKPAGAPDGLYGPVRGLDRVEGQHAAVTSSRGAPIHGDEPNRYSPASPWVTIGLATVAGMAAAALWEGRQQSPHGDGRTHREARWALQGEGWKST